MKTEIISEEELDGLIDRLKDAIVNNLSLSIDDMQLLLKMLLSFAYMQEQLNDSDVTMHKLKKLAGLVKSSEKFKDIVPSALTKEKNKIVKPLPEKEEKIVVHETSHHKLTELSKGQSCPGCQKGKLYKYEPGIFVRISGQAPLICTKHILEKLRCNSCGQYFSASLPEEVKADGEPNQMFGYSARAIMAIYKYYAGLPFHLQESLNHMFAMPVSASTVFEQCEHAANAIAPVFYHLMKLAADGKHYHLDDTTNQILSAEKELIPDRKSGKLRERSGVYTSGIIVTLADGHKVVFFKTNIGHAGEFLDEILKGRNAQAPPPIIMSDALSRNFPTAINEYHLSLCNAHARREFFDIYNHYPDKVEWVLERYGKIWENENQCRTLLLAERLAYHRQYSLPVLEEIRRWGQSHLEEVEANSSLGKAIKYFLKHFDGLSAFCRIEGAKLDNNEMEATLKLVIRGRKNSLFFKTQAGADIADVLTSVIATCDKINANSFEYLTLLQKHYSEVLKNPDLWMPWNYRNTLSSLQKAA
jgi:transposase